MDTLLWVIQIVLAIKFISSAFTHAFQHGKQTMQKAIDKLGGTAKPVLAIDSTLMVLGSLGLTLPGVMTLPAWLVPVSAALLAGMMLVSIFFHTRSREKPLIIADLVLFALCAFTAYERWIGKF